ncbi:MAG: Peroxyureidoacrylate/ureidoacrylate amidohydrolase RutB [Syntrophorhabdaceae bacterium PtaU1.Bin034]|jgi:nicotinamidase-related amidase|nr:MAG: Peroxyureidoacrylate/ureidoacrylate amidohydrolase RutB [Syntrophorhabdaceae bacterium PtaU1.Bin034]
MKPAVIVVDMLEDNYGKDRSEDREDVKIIRPVRDFLKKCRSLSIPVIFACDSFLEGDFIFNGRMKPHAIRGTAGEAVLAELEPEPSDIVLPKRRFSAFFKTDLDQTLRTLDVDTVAVGGINTHFCVLATALDAVCHDFYTVILEDLSAAYKRDIHESFMDAYRKSAIYPIFKIATAAEFLNAFLEHDKKA